MTGGGSGCSLTKGLVLLFQKEALQLVWGLNLSLVLEGGAQSLMKNAVGHTAFHELALKRPLILRQRTLD